MEPLKIVAVSCLLLSTLQAAYAVKCYQCFESMPECSLAANTGLPDRFQNPKECDNQYDIQGCLTVITESGSTGRYCSSMKSSSATVESWEQKACQLLGGRSCHFCTGDYCNGQGVDTVRLRLKSRNAGSRFDGHTWILLTSSIFMSVLGFLFL